jgi:hypothetical protein
MNLLRQHNIKRVGSFIHVLYLTMPLFGAGSYTMSAITMYTVLMPYFKDKIPWMTLPLFIGICLMACGIMLFCFYKFVYPSYMSFQNKQEYSHNNLIRQDLDKIKKALKIEDSQTSK